MNSPLFSIIIPVYNTEKYLSRCIESVLSQSYTDFEIILINDGSTDNSGEICNAYAKQNDKVKVYHQNNAGVSAARNVGLENAQGEWVLFVDSDDWVEANYLETVNRKMQLIYADLYIYGHRRLSNKEMDHEFCPAYTVESHVNFVKTQFYRHSCWNYVFRNSIIKKWDIKFPIELKHAEDQAFLLKYISTINNVVLINKILYNYWDHPDSVVNQHVDVSWAMSNILAANDFLKFCKLHNIEESFYEYPVKQLYIDFFTYYTMIEHLNKKNVKQGYRNTYKETLRLYPEFKKNKFFRLANYSLSLPETLYWRKQQIKNKMKKLFNKISRLFGFYLHLHYILDQKHCEILEEVERKLRIVQLQNQAFFSVEMGITNKKYCEHDVILSLTSYGKRIYNVYLIIESLMQQTIKPNKIILWLAEDEFTMDNIPQTLKNLQKRGLTIEFCEDIKSYKKLVPALIKYPDDIIITVDDDILYQYDLVENLLNSYKENPEIIHFCRGHRIKFKDDVIEKYINWDFYINDSIISKLNFPTGAGGILYPPHCLHSDVSNKNIFMSLAPYADDVWFKAMSLMKGTLSIKSFTHSSTSEDFIFFNSEIQTETSLWKNINKTKNDEQIRAVFEKYNIYELIR